MIKKSKINLLFCDIIFGKRDDMSMIIDDKYFDDNSLVGNENNFIKRIGNIYITDNQVNILNKYNINIKNYVNFNELIYDIEEYLNDSDNELQDLEWVSEMLSEYNYYNNTNK